MKKYFFNFIIYILNKNFLYKAYLSMPKKIKFEGIQNFNPIIEKREPVNLLIKINNNYFSSRKKTTIPLQMHSFEWLGEFKKTGGLDLLKKSRALIIDWNSVNFKLGSEVWSKILTARRIINLSINFDYYGLSGSDNFQKKIINLIYFHFKHLIILNKLQIDKYDIDLEISKSILIICKYFKKDDFFYKTVEIIKKQVELQVNTEGFHKSISAVEHAKFIHQLLEIKNILLYYKYKKWPEIDSKIIDMTSLLKNLFHKDSSLALFNGTNNKNLDYILSIANLKKDINIKTLFKINDGIIVVDADKTKLFFDITKPNSKLLNKKIHSGTLSFEMSCGKEKIITNCGSPEKYLGENQVFFRYSAAHSTITINNTNISELSKESGYKRIPKSIKSFSEEMKDFYVISASHDGYKKNFGLLLKRTLKIAKNGNSIRGIDQIFSSKINNKNSFEIRFHLMPNCICAITNNDLQAIIKSSSGTAWYFKSLKNKLNIEESLYIGDGDYPLATKQIILFGKTTNMKHEIEWELNKIN